MALGTCEICGKKVELYSNGACASCQAAKAGSDFGRWLRDYITRKVKDYLRRRGG